MTALFDIHPKNPQPRLIKRVVERVRRGDVIVYPTDSGYALGCQVGDKSAIERIRQIRQLSKDHNFTLLCRDLAEISIYARIDNPIFRLLKAHTPGPYTFVLPATKEVPKILQHPKRKTIGIRVPENAIAQAILSELNHPLMSATLILPGESLAMTDIDDIQDSLSGQVDIIINGGACGVEPTSIIDLTGDVPEVVRQGKGAISGL